MFHFEAEIEFHLPGKDPTKWYPGDPGWPLHVCSTVSEWLMALAFNTFLLTFVTEFKKVKLDSPKVNPRLGSVVERLPLRIQLISFCSTI